MSLKIIALFSILLILYSLDKIRYQDVSLFGSSQISLLTENPCENIPQGVPLEQKNNFDFLMKAGTFGRVHSWYPFSYQINKWDELFRGTIIFNNQGKFKSEQTIQKQVFHCKNEEEVSNVIKCADLKNIKISIRGGGHEFNGASIAGEWIITMKNFKEKIEVQQNGLVTLSANLRNGNIYKGLYDISKTINFVAGSCPTVQVSGYTLGGGHGFMTNYYGITAHYLKSVRMVKANGMIQEINDQNDQDLMWALRGGGHNLGAVTEFTFDYSSIPNHKWNGLVYNQGSVTLEQFKFNLMQFDSAVKAGAHYISGMHFGYQSWNNQVMMRLWVLAPSEGPNRLSVNELKQKISEQFPVEKSGLIFYHSLEDLPYHELQLTSFGELGSLGTEYNYKINEQEFLVSYHWNSKEASGLRPEINNPSYLEAVFKFLPERVQMNNYVYKTSGPFSQNSIYHPQPYGPQSNVAYMLQVYDPYEQSRINTILDLFNTNSEKYINYPPTYSVHEANTFFKNDSVAKLKSIKKRIDPQNVFFDKLGLQ